MTIREVLEAHPQSTSGDPDALVRCAEACSDCAAACTSCADADADLGERGLPELIRCVRLCLDCADICDATGRIVTRQTASDVDVVRAVVEACPVACRACRQECEHHEHCRICAAVCSRCEQACGELLASMG